MRLLGEIVRLQVQIASLKVGEAPHRRYDPAAIRVVPRLVVSEDGVTGLTEAGTDLADIHNRTHPATKNRRGTNGISIGFTSHYALMRSHFGGADEQGACHLPDGIAGENILVRPAREDVLVTEDDLRGELVIETAGGPVRLSALCVAAPCVEFARFCLRFPEDRRPDPTVTEAVQFLHDGTRGYYATARGVPATIATGDPISFA